MFWPASAGTPIVAFNIVDVPLAMIGVSTVAMLGLIYLNTYGLNHVFFSKTRAYWLS